MSEWVKCELGDVITLQRGHDLPKKKMIVGIVPVAGSNGIIGHHNKATTKAPGITLGRSGSIGNAHLYLDDFWAHNTTLYVKDFNYNDELFVYYFLKNINFSQFNVGSAVPTLNRNHIHPLKVSIPPLPEQKAIADVLSSLDDKIDLLHRQNETLEAMAQTLFRQWFVEEAGDDGKETIENLPIEIIDGDRGKNYPKNHEFFSNEHCLFLNAKNVTKDGFHFDNRAFITKEKDKILRSGKLNRQDIVLTTRGTVGNLAFFHDQIHFEHIRINSGMVIFRSASKELPPLYLYILMKSDYFSQLIREHVSGSAQPQLPIRDIKNMALVNPPKEKIANFMCLVDSLYNKTHLNQAQIRTLEKLRDTLLPKLMSGKVRVRH